jgi:hypothetical protein
MQNLAAGVQAMVIYVSGSYVDVFGKTHHVADCLSTVTTEFRPYFRFQSALLTNEQSRASPATRCRSRGK